MNTKSPLTDGMDPPHSEQTNSTDDTEPITERCVQPPWGPWEFGDPVAAAKTFVRLAELCLTELVSCVDFDAQRQHGLQLLAAAGGCAHVAELERAYGAAACGQLMESSVEGRAPWVSWDCSSNEHLLSGLPQITQRLGEVALALDKTTTASRETLWSLIVELRAVRGALDGVRGN